MSDDLWTRAFFSHERWKSRRYSLIYSPGPSSFMLRFRFFATPTFYFSFFLLVSVPVYRIVSYLALVVLFRRAYTISSSFFSSTEISRSLEYRKHRLLPTGLRPVPSLYHPRVSKDSDGLPNLPGNLRWRRLLAGADAPSSLLRSGKPPAACFHVFVTLARLTSGSGGFTAVTVNASGCVFSLRSDFEWKLEISSCAIIY